jgi:hypothetical protein
MPSLGWSGTVGMLVFGVLCVAGIFAYHAWLDRRLKRERERVASGGQVRENPGASR